MTLMLGNCLTFSLRFACFVLYTALCGFCGGCRVPPYTLLVFRCYFLDSENVTF